MVIADRYYALCAAAALFHWARSKQRMDYNDGSVSIQYETIRGTCTWEVPVTLTLGQMFIDSDSARNLELVQNNLSMKTTNTLYCKVDGNSSRSQPATLNSCYTPMGKRMLRASLLQPGNRTCHNV